MYWRADGRAIAIARREQHSPLPTVIIEVAHDRIPAKFADDARLAIMVH
jgi:hypothetical protein